VYIDDITVGDDGVTRHNALEEYHTLAINWFPVSESQRASSMRPWQPVAEARQSGSPWQPSCEVTRSEHLLLPVQTSPMSQQNSDAGKTRFFISFYTHFCWSVIQCVETTWGIRSLNLCKI